MATAAGSLLSAVSAHAQTISTVAGNGNASFSGDGQSAINAALYDPYDVASDAAGNLYIADSSNNRIRKVALDGVISTLAGTGAASYNGDGILATAAKLNTPYGVTVDAAGNVYIADTVNQRIRKIALDGVISTVAGTGKKGYYGDGGLATDAKLYYPNNIIVDGTGNLYIADTINQRIRKVTPNGIISTVAGNGSQGYSGDGGAATSAKLKFPYDMAIDAAGNLYIADTENQRIRKVTPSGAITTVAGTGTAGYGGDGDVATSAQLNAPIGVTFDAAGNLYISEARNQRLRKVTPGGIITTVAGSGVKGYDGDGGAATDAKLNGPNAVAVDGAGNLYIADTYNNRIRKVTDIDAHADVVWRNSRTGADMIWLSANSNTTWTVPPFELAWQVVGVGDFDGNGKDEILWRHDTNGSNMIWPSGIYLTAVSDSNWKVVGVGNFDADGSDDILWRNDTSGANMIWRGGNSANQIAVNTLADLAWNVVGVGNFDADGSDDILWRNDTSGANMIWRGGNSASQIAVTTVTDLTWKIVGVGDFDANGADDIFWRNDTSGLNAIWPGASAANQPRVNTVSDLAWKVVGVGDFDANGKDDIFWRHDTTGANTIWPGASTANQPVVSSVSDTNWKVVGVGTF